MKLEPVICLPSAWSSAYSRFVVHLFEGQLGLADMERMQLLGERWNAAHPGKRVELVVIFPSDAKMSHEERARMSRLIKHGEAQRAASATVILAEGILASVQRSVLTGLMMIVPSPHPVKICARVEEALRWLAPHAQSVCHPSLTTDALVSLVGENVDAFRTRATLHAS
ncbi:MAG TPA: hypothetical protein VFZ61_25495 [Polyangiales bacterium]